MITESGSAEVAQVWFQGLNPVLDDRSPAWLLREANLDDGHPHAGPGPEPQPSLTVDGRPVSIVARLTGCAGTAAEIEQAADVITAATWASA